MSILYLTFIALLMTQILKLSEVLILQKERRRIEGALKDWGTRLGRFQPLDALRLINNHNTWNAFRLIYSAAVAIAALAMVWNFWTTVLKGGTQVAYPMWLICIFGVLYTVIIALAARWFYRMSFHGLDDEEPVNPFDKIDSDLGLAKANFVCLAALALGCGVFAAGIYFQSLIVV